MAKKPDKDIEKLREAGKLDQFTEIVGGLDKPSNGSAPGKGGDV